MPNFSIRAIIPKDMSVFDGNAYVGRLVRKQLSETIPALETVFRHTVDGWEHKPTFKGTQRITRNSITMSVSASGPHADQYALVNSGSPPHTINARRGGLLRFQRGYRASTRPRMLSSRAKSRFGPYVGAVQVNHPGFEAREFDETIAELFQPIFEADMAEAMRV